MARTGLSVNGNSKRKLRFDLIYFRALSLRGNSFSFLHIDLVGFYISMSIFFAVPIKPWIFKGVYELQSDFVFCFFATYFSCQKEQSHGAAKRECSKVI